MEQIKEKNSLRALVLRSVAFLLPLLVILVLLSLLYVPKNNTSTAGMEFIEANGILAEPENSIDVLVIGDSESLTSLSPMQMWEEQGFHAYVCGSKAQSLMETNDFLNKALRTQSPKVLVLEANAIFRRMYPQQIVFNNVANRLPVFRYHDRWKSLNSNDFLSLPHYTSINVNKGFLIRRKHVPVGSKKLSRYMRHEKKKRKIRKFSRWYLNKIVKTCRKNGIQLVLFSIPSPHNWNYRKHNCIQHFADQNKLTYLDMNLAADEIGIDWSTDSLDGGDHLNVAGAQKATAYLGNWLKEQVSLPDRRSEADYQNWNDQLQQYHRILETGRDRGDFAFTEPMEAIAEQIQSQRGK